MSAMVKTAWPPRSPHAALLSSPSGRRRYQKYQYPRECSPSPSKHSTTSPNIQQRSRRLLGDNEVVSEIDGLEDDEETLQLKLAAIEAKLKLKKLQQNRIKRGIESTDRQGVQADQLSSSMSSTPASRFGHNAERSESKHVEVPVSPTRRRIPQAQQRSPGRVLLGIDKGKKGTDVSLGRARSYREHCSRGDGDANNTVAGNRNRTTAHGSVHDSRPRQVNDRPVKTFSERMAENRAEEQTHQKKLEAVASKSGVGFKLNRAELESFKKAASEARTHNPPHSPSKERGCAIYTKEDDLRSRGRWSPGLGRLERRPPLSDMQHHTVGTGAVIADKPRATGFAAQKFQSSDEARDGKASGVPPKGDDSLYDPFSQLQLSSRVLPHSFLQRTFSSETHACLRLPQLLRQVTAPAYELPGLEAKDVVIIGVVASKSTPLDHKLGHGTISAANGKGGDEWERKWEDGSKNQKRFMVLQLSDLVWSIDLYLFGTALPRYHRLSPGTVVAILNPGIMPPRKGKEDTGAFSLTLHSGDDTVLEIGTARDLGFCQAVKKDGHECGSWVNLTKTEICEWHLNAQITKTQAGRMGVNTGSNAIGRGVSGRRLKNGLVTGGWGGKGSTQTVVHGNQGRRFDKESQSQYYITSCESQRKCNLNRSDDVFERRAASLGELDDGDPFIAEGGLCRDTEARLKKRLLNEEKERDIARKLTTMGTGGAGVEYLKHRVGSTPDGRYPVNNHHHINNNEETARKKSAMATKDSIIRSGININGKRAAESVRLSPIKKTRFLTERGVREAGQESLGGDNIGQDDELDII